MIPTRAGNLTAADEAELLRRWHEDEDAQARAVLVERMLPLVRHIARGYTGRGEHLDDLVQVGSIGLVNAIDRFDLERGLRLSTFAAPTISGEIKRHFRDRGWMLRTPRALKELHGRLRVAEERFLAEHGKPPTIAELCTATGRDEDEVLEALEAGRSYAPASLDATVPGQGDLTIMDAHGVHDEGFDRAEDRATLSEAIRVLPEREQRIVLMRYFADLSQREIAEELGLSQMHISRLLSRSLDDLQLAAT